MVTSGPLLEIYERRASTKAASLAVACFVGFVAGVVLLHALRPDYNPLRDMISDYANGPYGYLLTASFAALGAGCLALLIGLRRVVAASGTLFSGLIFLGVAALGFVVGALFPTDPIGASITRTGVIHTFDSLISFTSMMLAMLFLSGSFRNDAHWGDYYAKAMWLTFLYVAAYAVLFYCQFQGSPFVGLAHRLAAFSMVAWLLSTALRLRGAAGRTP